MSPPRFNPFYWVKRREFGEIMLNNIICSFCTSGKILTNRGGQGAFSPETVKPHRLKLHFKCNRIKTALRWLIKRKIYKVEQNYFGFWRASARIPISSLNPPLFWSTLSRTHERYGTVTSTGVQFNGIHRFSHIIESRPQ